jgi:drug/metabolite transporter (DMT)-like permease
MLSILYALGSNITFATASLYFTDFSKKISPVWMNYFKAAVAFVCFLFVCLVFQINLQISRESFFYLVVSGWAGLMIGDIFLLRAFTHLGSGRVLMIFGFQPLILGVASYYLFNEGFSLYRLVAILFLMTCLFCFSLESAKEKGHWDLQGILLALLGVGLDACGLLLTKKAFDLTPGISVFLANAIRSGATVFGFLIVSLIPCFQIKLAKPFLSLQKKDKVLVVMASFLGTFLSLACYLHAIQIGHLATISAIAGTSPLFATLFEIYKGRKKMTRYLALAMSSFVLGVATLILV